jgi:glycosyltransferase involved in cell wall biosynthesis
MLREMLESLESQTLPASEFEVIVVDDGGSDGTVEMIEGLKTSYTLRGIRQPQSGPSRARNHGAQEAKGMLLIFMDDDMLPEPGMFASHADILRKDPANVVLGKLMPWGKGARGGWNRWEERVYARHYAAVESNKRPPSGRRLYSGNFSIWRDRFVNAGGFDESLKRGEDVELGFRLERGGAKFHFSGGAAAFHRGYRTYKSWRNSAYLYGRTDVELALKRGHMQVLDEISRWYVRRHIAIRALVKTSLIGGKPVRSIMEGALRTAGGATHRLGLTKVSHACYSIIFNLSYWQGAADEIGGRGALMKCAYGTPEYRASLAAKPQPGGLRTARR